jgi:hypothetical protein
MTNLPELVRAAPVCNIILPEELSDAVPVFASKLPEPPTVLVADEILTDPLIPDAL